MRSPGFSQTSMGSFQVLKGQVYKHQLQYLAGDSGPEPGFSTLWWESHYHFISILPVPPLKPLPECSTLTRQTQPSSFPHSWTEMREKPLKTFWGSHFLSPHLHKAATPWPGAFLWRPPWGLGGEDMVVPIVLLWQRKFLMKCMRPWLQKQGIS